MTSLEFDCFALQSQPLRCDLPASRCSHRGKNSRMKPETAVSAHVCAAYALFSRSGSGNAVDDLFVPPFTVSRTRGTYF